MAVERPGGFLERRPSIDEQQGQHFAVDVEVDVEEDLGPLLAELE